MKKYIFAAIIIVSIIVKIVLNNINSIELSRIIIFCLTIPFYVITFVYYRRSKMILAFVFVGIFSFLGYEMFYYFIDTFTLASPMMRILGSISLFGSIINIGLAFAIVLLTNRGYSIAVMLLILAIFNFLFLSYINYYLIDLLYENFQLAEPGFNRWDDFQNYYKVFFIIIQLAMALMQAYVILILDHDQEIDEHPLKY